MLYNWYAEGGGQLNDQIIKSIEPFGFDCAECHAVYLLWKSPCEQKINNKTKTKLYASLGVAVAAERDDAINTTNRNIE